MTPKKTNDEEELLEEPEVFDPEEEQIIPDNDRGWDDE